MLLSPTWRTRLISANAERSAHENVSVLHLATRRPSFVAPDHAGK
jgi:hypothetical protein